MERVYSVWSIFDEADEKYLSSIVADFNKGYRTDYFRPHITLFGNITAPEDFLKEAIEEAAEGVSPFTVMLKDVEYSPEWSKTFYMQFAESPELQRIYEELKDKFKGIADYSFDPHASLIYKTDMTEEQKLAERQHLHLKKKYKMSGLVLATPDHQKEKWIDVASWKIPYERQFGR